MTPPQATVPPFGKALGGTRGAMMQTSTACTWIIKIAVREWCGITGKTTESLLKGLRWKSVQRTSKVKHGTLIMLTKRGICAQQIHKGWCILVLKVKFPNKLEAYY